MHGIMVFYFCSYFITIKTLAMTRNRKLPRVADSGYDPFIADVKQALEQPPQLSLGLGFDNLFKDIRGVILPKKPADEKTEGWNHPCQSRRGSTCAAGT
jgi:hypothetical protein